MKTIPFNMIKEITMNNEARAGEGLSPLLGESEWVNNITNPATAVVLLSDDCIDGILELRDAIVAHDDVSDVDWGRFDSALKRSKEKDAAAKSIDVGPDSDIAAGSWCLNLHGGENLVFNIEDINIISISTNSLPMTDVKLELFNGMVFELCLPIALAMSLSDAFHDLHQQSRMPRGIPGWPRGDLK